MDLSREDKSIFIQLSDMFAEVPQAHIRQVCEENAFNIELCIDQLIISNQEIRTNEGNFSIATGQQQQALNDSKWSSICRSSSCDKDMQQGAIPKGSINQTHDPSERCQLAIQSKSVKYSYQSKKFFTTQEQKLLDKILAGYKVMVLMRGAPGCGKSYLANALVQKSIVLNNQYKLKDFVCGADDYFFNSRGQYKYNVEKLSDAHYFNQRRVYEKAANGWSPIFVDNTSMKLWEMLPYAQAAVQYGYILEILEPMTSWRFSPGKLAMKNRHHVQKEKIQIMLDKYEKGTVNDLFKMLKNTKYSLPLPQMRNYPPIVIQDEEMDTNENFQDFNSKPIVNLWSNESTTITKSSTMAESAKMHESTLFTCDTTATDNPKPQRNDMKSKSLSKIALNLPKNDTELEEENNNKLLQDPPPLVWKPYELEANHFWGLSQEESETKPSSESSLLLSNTKSEKTLLDLLKEGVNEFPPSKADVDNEPEEQTSFQRHKVNCLNENKSFVSLRQIYPNKQLTGLWDLFVKCNGDIDWAVDILLKEDELSTSDSHYNAANDEDNECVLTCSCTSFGDPRPPNEIINLLKLPPQNTGGNIKPQRLQKVRAQRFGQNASSAQREVKEAIENNFVLGEEFYSQHVRKIKSLRSGNVENTQPFLSPRSYTDIEVQTDPVMVVDAEDDMEIDDGNDLLEINLGEDFVQQLRGIFSTETFNSQLPENLKTNVFMPKTLAKELFMLWMESAYNQIEEKRQSTLREDEEFAHLLKNPKYEHFKETPKNIKEILDMELSWMIYKNEHDEQKQLETRNFPTDIASHLTQMKLCELFPNIPRDTLLDILAAHGNKFKETIEVLQSSMNTDECTTTTQEKLLERAIQENELLNNQEAQQKHQYKNQYPMHSLNDYQKPVKSPLLPDESKRIALHEFEDTRNFAAHHCQLKAECYQKAKDAIQKGNSAIAVYYSQIANLHKKKVDMYNHRAANCIMEVHKYTQNNPELLDLHYLYVQEAVGCLDLFLDRHITNLRSLSKSYKHVFIITGRGLHSAGGVSTIKSKVKSRLKERSLRWSEVNPGLLKVKIFSASRYSKNI